MKIANYPIIKTRFNYKNRPDRHEPFIIREDLLLDNILREQQEISNMVRVATDEIQGNALQLSSLTATQNTDAIPLDPTLPEAI